MTAFRPPRSPIVPPGGMELHERDMTATFAGDVMLGAAQERLAEIGQWLPMDGDPNATLGSLVSFNSTGPLRLGYGAWRDLLLGVQFANGRGELISAGGRTVKNVAGYDLTKFIVGSAGVFGTLVTLTARTYRRPEGALLARHRPDAGLVRRLMPTALRPQWAMLTGDALLLGYIGDRRTLDYYRTALSQSEPLEILERSLEEDVADRARLWQWRGALGFRAAVPPARVEEFARGLANGSWVADAAFGVVLGSHIEREQIPVIKQAVAAVGGSVRFIARADRTEANSAAGESQSQPQSQSEDFHTAGASQALADLSTNPIERQIIERLKLAFDPDSKLNPLPWRIP
ncbi:MAG TPA: FAD-binding oxidoreductase [Tepidisphaeraceae bacterium]|nr:FAD-binding oxidoreductase [Tepidisphaeraceae bacterium]